MHRGKDDLVVVQPRGLIPKADGLILMLGLWREEGRGVVVVNRNKMADIKCITRVRKVRTD